MTTAAMQAPPQAALGPERLRTLKAALEHLHGHGSAGPADLGRGLIAQQPRDIEALLLLGLALGGQGETEQAVLLLTKVGRDRPNHAHPCADLADLLRRLDRLPEAYAQFRAARDLEPADIRLTYAHAEFLLETGQPAQSPAETEETLQPRPGFPAARGLRAPALAESRGLGEA